jgi:SNF-related kinase
LILKTKDYLLIGETIGTGHFAVVKLARHVFTQKEVAVKVIDKTRLDEVSKAHLFQEVTCMKLVQHPNVVRLYEVIDTPNKLYLILELGDGGDMYDYIMKHANGLNELSARRYFRQICRALKYCQKQLRHILMILPVRRVLPVGRGL